MDGISYQPYASRAAQELYQQHVQEPDNEAQVDRLEEMREWEPDWRDDFSVLDDASTHSPYPEAASDVSNTEYYAGASTTYGRGKTFVSEFFTDKYADLRHDNIFYPFASQGDWQLGSWLLRSGLSMAAINSFLSLDLVSTYLR